MFFDDCLIVWRLMFVSDATVFADQEDGSVSVAAAVSDSTKAIPVQPVLETQTVQFGHVPAPGTSIC